MNLSDLVNFLSSAIPLSLQEDYDNAGLQLGHASNKINAALLTVDITDSVIDEAIQSGADIIISHHPLIFKGLRKLTGSNSVERIVEKAIKNNIAIYSSHTNLDVMKGGVSYKMAEKLNLTKVKALAEIQNRLLKLVVFVPIDHVDGVKKSIYDAGAGSIGNYDHCSFSVEGNGSFRAGEGSTPFKGEINKDHLEKEIRIEVILEDYLKDDVIAALLRSHPYEEVAYDIYRLENKLPGVGMGCIGELRLECEAKEFLEHLAEVFDARGIRYSGQEKSMIKKVALCGGSGSSLIAEAYRSGADIFISADIKYHSFFEGNNTMVIADIGHYESEKFSLEILYEIITKKFPKFAVRFSKSNTNPINYL